MRGIIKAGIFMKVIGMRNLRAFNTQRCIMKKFWHKNKKTITSTVLITVILIFFVFVVPIIINWMYKTPARLPIFAMSWEAKDVLSFYGSILGAAATIIALTKTIKFTRENQRE